MIKLHPALDGTGGSTILCMPDDMRDKPQPNTYDIVIHRTFVEMKAILHWCIDELKNGWRTVDTVGKYWRLKSKSKDQWITQLDRWENGFDDSQMPDDLYLYATFRFTDSEDAAHFKLKYYDGTTAHFSK